MNKIIIIIHDFAVHRVNGSVHDESINDEFKIRIRKHTRYYKLGKWP